MINGINKKPSQSLAEDATRYDKHPPPVGRRREWLWRGGA